MFAIEKSHVYGLEYLSNAASDYDMGHQETTYKIKVDMEVAKSEQLLRVSEPEPNVWHSEVESHYSTWSNDDWEQRLPSEATVWLPENNSKSSSDCGLDREIEADLTAWLPESETFGYLTKTVDEDQHLDPKSIDWYPEQTSSSDDAHLELNPESSEWYPEPDQNAQCHFNSRLSVEASPFVPSELNDVSDDTLSMEDVMMQSPTPAHSAPHIKAPRKKHASIVPTTKWSKQKERDEFSSNEDLATNSEDVVNISEISILSISDEDPGVADDVNTSESESSPKIRRKHKKKSTVRQRGCKKLADSNDENKENNGSAPNTDRSMIEIKRCRAITPPLREHIKLNLPEFKLIEYLQPYCVSSNDLKSQGFPYRYGDKAGFFKKRFGNCVEYSLPTIPTMPFDVNAREFVPNNKRRSLDRKFSSDSGRATGSSSSWTDSDSSDNTSELKYHERTEKKCVRCTREFHVTESGEYIRSETCSYHWGKLERSYAASGTYTCCGSPRYSKGCTVADEHVWSGYEMGFNGPLDDYVRTEYSDKPVGAHSLYALDCEMCYTGKGLEVTKVTLVSSDGQKVYEKFVRPATKIIDYNTRFSGITKKDLVARNNRVASLPEVQQDLLQYINADTILIGHALDNDLRALKIIHDKVIDTSLSFEHENGSNFKHSLRSLTLKYLNRTIQNSDQGHSSFEDSRACLELMLWRVRKDYRPVLEQ